MKTIPVSEDLLEELEKRRVFEEDGCEDIIWDVLEESMELSEETKKDIKQSMKEIEEGKIISLEDLKRELGF